MRNVSTILSVLTLTTLFAACSPEERSYGNQGGAGGSGGAGGQGGAGGDPQIAVACESYGQKVCDAYAVCSPAAIIRAFGDDATCRERYSIFCNALLTAPGTSWVPQTIVDCASAYGQLDCNALLGQPFRSSDDVTPAACVPGPGALADGASCIDASQCQSLNCHRAFGAFCGICGPKANAGEACTLNSDCLGHQVCWGSTCTKASELGEPCDAMAPCNAPWVCFGGTCHEPGQLGETCGGNGPDCSVLQGLACVNYQCAAIDYSQPGQVCGDIQGTPTECAASGNCLGATGMCAASAKDGEPCDPNNGPHCMLPALCVNGTCKTPSAAACN
jgi:hypothetical protein